MNIDQNFTDHGASGAPQQPYPMQSQYMTGDVYKHQSHMNEQQFNSRGVGPNFQTQGFYQQEQMRQMANVSINISLLLQWILRYFPSFYS